MLSSKSKSEIIGQTTTDEGMEIIQVASEQPDPADFFTAWNENLNAVNKVISE